MIPKYCLNIFCDDGSLLYVAESIDDLDRQLIELYQSGFISSDSTVFISVIRYHGAPDKYLGIL